MSKLLNVSSSPHARSSVSTQNLMYDVAIAMLPATIWGVMQFGFYSLVVVAATVLSCVLSEYVFETLMKKPITISDGSALVTGMILGLNMPPTIPLWIPVLGGMFAIIVVKQLYGWPWTELYEPCPGSKMLPSDLICRLHDPVHRSCDRRCGGSDSPGSDQGRRRI